MDSVPMIFISLIQSYGSQLFAKLSRRLTTTHDPNTNHFDSSLTSQHSGFMRTTRSMGMTCILKQLAADRHWEGMICTVKKLVVDTR